MFNFINKNSFTYFILFFTLVIFGIIFSISKIHSKLEGKIELAKNEKIVQIIKNYTKCSNIKSAKISNEIFYYCNNKKNIAKIVKSKKAFADSIEYLLFLNLEGKVEHIDIISHKETPGLGAKIENQNWLQTIYNKTINSIGLKSEGGNIDSFTSASITPRVLLKSIKEQMIWFKNNKPTIISKIKN